MAPHRSGRASPFRSAGRGRSRKLPRGLGLREATARDIPVLVLHRRRMWEELRAYSVREHAAHDRTYRRWVRQLMRRRKFFAWVAEGPAGRVAGSGALWLMPSQPRPGVLGRGETPYILSMYTQPEFRKLGIATRIVREMLRWCRAQRYGRVTLHASRFGRSVYERLGFEPGSEMRFELAPQPAAPRTAPPAPRRLR